jgi:TonB family protein
MVEHEDRLQLFVGISVALHALLFWLLLSPLISSMRLPRIPMPIELVEIPRPVPRSASRPREVPATPQKEALPTPQVRPETPPAPPNQRFHDVVEIPKPAVEQTPRDTTILSRYNQRVPRPARARDLPIDNRGLPTEKKTADILAKPTLKDTERRSAEAKEAEKAQRAQARESAGGAGGRAQEERVARLGRPGEAGAFTPPEPLGADSVFRRKPGEGTFAQGRSGLAGPGQGLKDLLPKEERLAQLESGPKGGRNNPYNPALVPVDAKMSMDTLKDENVGYYLAVKSRLALNWDPLRLIRAADDDYKLAVQNFGSASALAASAGDAVARARAETGWGTTVITFTIGKDGRLVGDPKFTQSSGVRFLDEEALKAVRLGDPFPPVPDRLAKDSLTLDWGFILGR